MKLTRKAETPLIFTSWVLLYFTCFCLLNQVARLTNEIIEATREARSGLFQAHDIDEARSTENLVGTSSEEVTASTDSPVEQHSIGPKPKVTLTNRITNLIPEKLRVLHDDLLKTLRAVYRDWKSRVLPVDSLMTMPAVYSDWNLAYEKYEVGIIETIKDHSSFESWHNQDGLVDQIWKLIYTRTQLTDELGGFSLEVDHYIRFTKLPRIFATVEYAASSRLKDMVERSEREPNNRKEIEVEFSVLKQFLEVEGQDRTCSTRIEPSISDFEKLKQLFPDSNSMQILESSRYSIPPSRPSYPTLERESRPQYTFRFDLKWRAFQMRAEAQHAEFLDQRGREPIPSQYATYVHKIAEIVSQFEETVEGSVTNRILTPLTLTLEEFKKLDELDDLRRKLIRVIAENRLGSRSLLWADELVVLTIQSISGPASHKAIDILHDWATGSPSEHVKMCDRLASAWSSHLGPPPEHRGAFEQLRRHTLLGILDEGGANREEATAPDAVSLGNPTALSDGEAENSGADEEWDTQSTSTEFLDAPNPRS